MKTVWAKNTWFFESDLRLDAEFHLSDGPATVRLFKKSRVKTLPLQSLCAPLFKGQIFKRCIVKDKSKGVPFISPSGMMKFDMQPDFYLSEKYTAQIKELRLDEKWILVSRSGTLGLALFTNKSFLNFLGSDDLIRIIPKSKEVSPGFLYAFLAGKFGFSLLTQSSYGGVVKHIEPHHIQGIPIPILATDFQTEVESKISRCAELRYDALCLQEECNNIFKSYMPTFEKDSVTSFKTVCASRFTDKQRLNGFYYLSVGDDLETNILDGKFSFLRELISADIFTNGRGKRIYSKSKSGVPFLSNTNISSFNPFNSSNYVANKFVTSKNTIRENYILTGRVGQDTVGQVYYPIPKLIGCVASDNIIRIPIDDEALRCYVFAFLKSDIGYSLIRKRKSGVGQPFITEDMLATIPIMAVKDDDKALIIKKIKAAITMQNEALSLELEAISMIEQEIESWQK